MYALGSLLAQVQLTTTDATVIYTASQLNTEITRINICNTDDAANKFTLYHAQETTYNDANTLIKEEDLAVNTTYLQEISAIGSGIQLDIGHSLAVKADTAGKLTVHVYGITENRVPR